MSIWHYTGEDRQPLGPLTTDELKERLRAGEIGFDTLVWREGMLAWRALGELAEPLRLHEIVAPQAEAAPPTTTLTLEPIRPGPPPPPPVEPEPPEAAPEPPLTGRAVFALGTDPADNPLPVAWRESAGQTGTGDGPSQNPYAPSQASLRARQARDDQDVVYAGFWKRVAAQLIDGVILAVIGSLGGEMLGTLLSDIVGGGETGEALLPVVFTLILYLLYFAWFQSNFMLATPGKMAVGIKVVRGNGEPSGFLRNVARYFAQIPGSLLLGVGYLMAAFTRRKQAMHDFICDTVVVDRYAYTRQSVMQRHELGTVTVVVLAIYGALLALFAIGVLFLGFGLAMLRH